jgi:protein-S-isoprenylcysteine O-methyltransferase Ste14
MFWLYRLTFPVMWIGYVAYWRVMSTDVKPSERTEPAAPRLLRLFVVLLAFAMLVLSKFPVPSLNLRFLPDKRWTFWVGAAVTAAGLLFSIWARRHLGKNCSQAVTLKQDHELITGGPYGLVRHPIYSGLLLAISGSAMAPGEWRGLLALALIFVMLWRKLRLEEEWMGARFGQEYETYANRVRALVPFIV